MQKGYPSFLHPQVDATSKGPQENARGAAPCPRALPALLLKSCTRCAIKIAGFFALCDSLQPRPLRRPRVTKKGGRHFSLSQAERQRKKKQRQIVYLIERAGISFRRRRSFEMTKDAQCKPSFWTVTPPVFFPGKENEGGGRPQAAFSALPNGKNYCMLADIK